MQKFKVTFDTATLPDMTAIASYRMEELSYSEESTRQYLLQLLTAFREKLENSPLR